MYESSGDGFKKKKLSERKIEEEETKQNWKFDDTKSVFLFVGDDNVSKSSRQTDFNLSFLKCQKYTFTVQPHCCFPINLNHLTNWQSKWKTKNEIKWNIRLLIILCWFIGLIFFFSFFRTIFFFLFLIRSLHFSLFFYDSFSPLSDLPFSISVITIF